MCFKQTKVDVPPVTNPPSRADQKKKAVGDIRRRGKDQTGVMGNIFTSALGDAGYGTNAAKKVQLGTAAPTATS